VVDEEIKSLSAWRLEIQKNGKSHWLKFYEALLGSPVSNKQRFYRCLNLYGTWALFEAILATSNATIDGDPLNYVAKVTHSKWKEMQKDEEEEAEVNAQIEEQKKLSIKQNEELAKKLKKKKK
jgi:hypothetical protein